MFIVRFISPNSYVLFKKLFALLVVLEIWYQYLLTSYFSEFYLNPEFHFKYPGFSWVPSLDSTGLHALLIATSIILLLWFFGIVARYTSLLSFILFSWIFLMESSGFLNHWYLIAFLCGILTVYEWNDFLNGKGEQNKFGYFHQYQSQIALTGGIVLFFSGLIKCNTDWIYGNTLTTYARWFVPEIGLWPKWIYIILSVLVIIQGILIYVLLRNKRTRKFGMIEFSVFLICNQLALNIGTFPLMTFSLFFLCFYNQEIDRWLAKRTGTQNQQLKSLSFKFPLKPITVGLMGLLVALSIRPFLYKDYTWQGGDKTVFGWNMFIALPIGTLKFILVNEENKTGKEIELSDYMSHSQISKLVKNPDLVVECIQQLKRKNSWKDGDHIYAQNLVSLNSNEAFVFIDPNYDLMLAERQFWKPYKWVIPREKKNRLGL